MYKTVNSSSKGLTLFNLHSHRNLDFFSMLSCLFLHKSIFFLFKHALQADAMCLKTNLTTITINHLIYSLFNKNKCDGRRTDRWKDYQIEESNSISHPGISKCTSLVLIIFKIIVCITWIVCTSISYSTFNFFVGIKPVLSGHIHTC